MSKDVEKKYRVQSFDTILNTIQRLAATPTIDVSSKHYYAQLDTDDTLKMIDYGDRIEIHSLSTKKGLHTLDKIIPVSSLEEGFKWFKDRGYGVLEVLDMNDKEFAFKDGGFALYTIDNNVYSVILGYSEEKIAEMESILGLKSAEPIDIPYNKYMRKLGILKTVTTN